MENARCWLQHRGQEGREIHEVSTHKLSAGASGELWSMASMMTVSHRLAVGILELENYDQSKQTNKQSSGFRRSEMKYLPARTVGDLKERRVFRRQGSDSVGFNDM